MDINSIYLKKLTEQADMSIYFDEVLEELWKETEGQELKEIDLRKKFEEIYLEKIRIQLRAARLFHPMSEFGKVALRNAMATQREYEKKVGSLVTVVTEGGISKFEPLMSPDIMEDILEGKMQAISALRYRKGAVYAAGLLAFRLEPDRAGESTMLRIEWLYVADVFREEGIADMLLGYIIDRCIESGVEGITFGFPDDDDCTQAYYGLLSDWHFGFERGFTPEFMTAVSKETITKNVEAMAYTAQSVSEISDKEFKDIVKSLSEDATLKQLEQEGFAFDYYDSELSCVSRKDSMKALLLAHRLPSGIVRTEYLGWGDGSGAALKGLICFLAVKTRQVCGNGTMISVPIESDELARFIDETFEVQLRIPIVEASLYAPLPDEDIDLATGAYILAGEIDPEGIADIDDE